MRTPKTESKKQEAALIGARLKKVRKEAGLSLQEIADRLNRDFNANTNKGMFIDNFFYAKSILFGF